MKHKDPTFTIRIEKELRERLERAKIKSEKNWNDFLKDLLIDFKLK